MTRSGVLIQSEALRRYRLVRSAAAKLDEAGYPEQADSLRDGILKALWPELSSAEQAWVESRNA